MLTINFTCHNRNVQLHSFHDNVTLSKFTAIRKKLNNNNNNLLTITILLLHLH